MTTQEISENRTFLRFVDFADINLWDVKRYKAGKLKSNFDIVLLGQFINEEATKLKPQDFPNQEFKILGVNNKTGIFDAYSQATKEIKQAYKKMDIGFIAYNPYRVNVGSIGMRTNEHKNDLISPAYVVFSCKPELNPDFLYKLFKTDKFNQIIKDNTTGSVRQNLTFDILKTIKIPLPKIEQQEKILNSYYHRISIAKHWDEKANRLTKYIEEYLLSELGVELPKKVNKEFGRLQFVDFRKTQRWDPQFLLNAFEYKSKYDLAKINTVIDKFFIDKEGNSLRFNPSLHPKININYIGMENIEKETGYLIEYQTVLGKTIKSQTVNIPKDYFIYGKLRSYLNKYWQNVEGVENLTCSSEFFVFSITKKINNFYFKYVLASNLIQLQISEITSGARMPRINESQFLELKIPIPDISIQDRIADKITRIKSIIKKLRTSADNYRNQAIEEFENTVIR